MKNKNQPSNFGIWIEARKRFKLTDCQIQMAREMGLNPKKFGGLQPNQHEPWKSPLGEFIEDIYFKRFKKERPEKVVGLEVQLKEIEAKERERRKRKQAEQEAGLISKND
jgi:hypothetical protein